MNEAQSTLCNLQDLLPFSASAFLTPSSEEVQEDVVIEEPGDRAKHDQ